MRNAIRMMCFAAVVLACGRSAQAGYIDVFGSPAYDPNTQTGFKDASMPVPARFYGASCVNDTGTAVGKASKYDAGIDLGPRAVRWDGGGAAATELGNIGTDSSGYTFASSAYAVNNAGTAVGYASKYDAENNLGERAVRWDAGGTAATELGHLGTNSSWFTEIRAYAINDTNTAVGWAKKYVAGNPQGWYAVRWDGGGTAATELGHIGLNSSGSTVARAFAVNNAGTAVGGASKYVDGSHLGERAVRWDAGGTAATELGNLGLDSRGNVVLASAYAVNDAGTSVGYAAKYVGGNFRGERAVRWDGGGTAATELGDIGLYTPTGYTSARANDVNDAGTVVGESRKYAGEIDIGWRAVRWDAGGSAATELGNLGTDSSGYTYSLAYAVNSTNTAVGFASKYVDGSHLGRRAVMWGSDGVAVDLNTLIDPAGGWTLKRASTISEHGLWIGGEGLYDPDGPGPLVAYDRIWVMQVPDPIPAADAGGPYTINVGDPLTLNASDSTDIDDNIISYMWDLNDDEIYETNAGADTVHAISYTDLVSLGVGAGGPYDIHLKVTDATGRFDLDDSTLTINAFPSADADGPYIIDTGYPLILNASGSTDVDGDIVSYLWDLNNDGLYETDAGGNMFFVVGFDDVMSLGLTAGDTYDIHLKVTDTTGLFDTADSRLKIIPEPGTLSFDNQAVGDSNWSSPGNWGDQPAPRVYIPQPYTDVIIGGSHTVNVVAAGQVAYSVTLTDTATLNIATAASPTTGDLTVGGAVSVGPMARLNVYNVLLADAVNSSGTIALGDNSTVSGAVTVASGSFTAGVGVTVGSLESESTALNVGAGGITITDRLSRFGTTDWVHTGGGNFTVDNSDTGNLMDGVTKLVLGGGQLQSNTALDLSAMDIEVADSTTLDFQSSQYDDLTIAADKALTLNGPASVGFATLTTGGDAAIDGGSTVGLGVMNLGGTLNLNNVIFDPGAAIAVGRGVVVAGSISGTVAVGGNLTAANLSVGNVTISDPGAVITVTNQFTVDSALDMSAGGANEGHLITTGATITCSAGGSLIYDKAISAATVELSGGRLEFNAGGIAITDKLSLRGDSVWAHTGAGNFTAGNSTTGNLIDGVTELTLNGGRLAIEVNVSVAPPADATAYYSFDNVDLNTDTVFNDGAAAGYNGTFDATGSPVLPGVTTDGGGRIGEGMTIADNSGQQMIVGDGGVPLNTDNWTIATWFYNLHDTSAPRNLVRGRFSDYIGLILVGSTDIGMRLGMAQAVGSGVDVFPGDGWHHLAIVGNGTDTDFYVDGGFGGTATGQSNTKVFYIGNCKIYPFAEIIDEFYVYNRALSETEIQRLSGKTPINLPETNVTVPVDSTLAFESTLPVTLGGVTVGGGVRLGLAGESDDIRLTNLTLGDGASLAADDRDTKISVSGRLSSVGSVGSLGGPAETHQVSLTLETGAGYEWEFGKTVGVVSSDLVVVNGNLELNDNWVLKFLPAGGSEWFDGTEHVDLFSFTGTLTGDLTAVVFDAPADWITDAVVLYEEINRDGTGINYVGMTGLETIPEPATLSMLVLGGLAVLRRRRR